MGEGTIIDGTRSYVAGRWVDGAGPFPVENPADESHVADVGATPRSEVARAVAEARRSFDDEVWSRVPAPERARVLHAFIDHVASRQDDLVATMMAEAGQLRMYAEHAQFAMGVEQGRNTVELYLSMAHEEYSPVPVDELVRGRVALSVRRHEPVGVVSAITPYNGAVIVAFQKLVPALMAGNSVVLRPSPLTPLSSLVFGEAAEAAGLPPGVLSARVEDMDRAGILASLCFPTITRFCGQLFMEAGDREFGFECLRHYNDFIVDEWCGAAPGRYIPLMLIPMWDPPRAAREMERMAAKGVTAFAFSENPEPLGLPTIHDTGRYWDPVMAAADELGMVACMHVGSSSTLPRIATDAPFMANLTWGAMRTSGTMLAWLFSGLFQRFPNLKIALSEGEVGWIPYFLERAEQVLDKQRYWVMRGQKFMDHAVTDVDLDQLDIRQSFRDHVFGCFIEDHHGVASLAEIGEDNVMCETDYPHSDSTWPDCIGTARRVIKDHTPEVQHKLLRGNAERLYRFTPAEPPATTGA